MGNASTYKLLSNLHMLDARIVQFNRESAFAIIRKRAKESMQMQNTRNEKAYNLRTRNVTYQVGQEVFRRNKCSNKVILPRDSVPG